MKDKYHQNNSDSKVSLSELDIELNDQENDTITSEKESQDNHSITLKFEETHSTNVDQAIRDIIYQFGYLIALGSMNNNQKFLFNQNHP